MPKFNKQAYLACDTKAKNAIRSYLDSKGVFTKVFEDYGPDIQSWQQVWHEVEIKSSWENEWPPNWKTVHIPARKKKYLEGGRKVMFWVLNKDCSEAILIDGKHLEEDYVEVIPNTRYPSGEHFYDIPIHLTKRICLT